jgi:hypothetical protein
MFDSGRLRDDLLRRTTSRGGIPADFSAATSDVPQFPIPITDMEETVFALSARETFRPEIG